MRELDEFLNELIDRADEIEGSLLNLGRAPSVWVHTPQQVVAWIEEARGAWAMGNYKTEDAE